jgi:transcriptional regulator
MNPQSKAMIEETQRRSTTCEAQYLDEEVLVLFTAAANHYVTPKFYVETKPQTGKVVPTWNYAAAQAYGLAKIYFDSKSEETVAFLSKQVHDLSQHAEVGQMGYSGENGRKSAWKVSDAPERYIELLRKNIIGIEIELTRLEGKFKMSQEMGSGDVNGIVEGFEGLGSEVGRDMARLVTERAELKKRKGA